MKPTHYLFLGLFLFCAESQANLVQNGSFEDPKITSPDNYQIFGPGDTIPNWNIITTTDITRSHNGYNASHGEQFLDLSALGGFNFGVSQNLTLTQNTVYSLTFDIGSYSDFGGTVCLNNNACQFGSSVQYAFLDSSNKVLKEGSAEYAGQTPGQINWSKQVFDFNSGSNTDVLLRFLTVTPTNPVIGYDYNYNALLDNVSLTAVPLPSALWLLASGIMGLLGFRKKYHRAAA